MRNKAGLSPRMKWTFLSCLIFGLAAHGMGLLNKFSVHDDIVCLFWTGSSISSGRWMLHVIGWLETLLLWENQASLPVFNGLFALGCIGAAACLLVWLLDLRRLSLCVGLSFVLTAFPVIAGLFGYMFTLPYYMLAMLMTVAGVCLICRGNWWRKGLGILLGCCAAGIYQTFLPLLLSLTLIWDLRLISERDEKPGFFAKTFVLQLLCALAAVGLYYAASGFFLRKFGLEMNEYMGLNQQGSTPVSEYLARAGTAYREFFLPTRNVSADMYPMHAYYLYLAMTVLSAAAGLLLLLRIGKSGQNGKSRALWGAALLALFPLGCDFIYVMSDRVHGLMTFSLTASPVLFAWLWDRIPLPRPSWKRAASGAAAALLGLMGVMDARFDNQCYLKAEFQQRQAITFFTALAAQIRGTEGFSEETPVVFLNPGKIQDQTLYNIDELNFIHLPPYGEEIEGVLNSYAWRAFMERWCGFSPAWTEEAPYLNLPEVRDMPHYPDDGSIRLVEDAIVVKF